MIEFTGVPFNPKDDMTHRPSPTRADGAREQLVGWLKGLGYIVTPIVRDDLRWGLSGKLEEGDPGIGIGMLNTSADQVCFQITYQLEAGLRDRIALLAPSARRELILDLKLLLVTIGATFAGAEEPLERLNLFVIVFTENLKNRTIVVETIYQVQRSYFAAVWFLQRRFPDFEVNLKTDGGLKSGFVN